MNTNVRQRFDTNDYENYINGNKERSGINSSIKYWIISAKFVRRKYILSRQRHYFDVTVSPPVSKRLAVVYDCNNFKSVDHTVVVMSHESYSLWGSFLSRRDSSYRRFCFKKIADKPEGVFRNSTDLLSIESIPSRPD